MDSHPRQSSAAAIHLRDEATDPARRLATDLLVLQVDGFGALSQLCSPPLEVELPDAFLRSPPLSGNDFNWKLAALRATAHGECLLATCMWNGHRVMIVPPWKERVPMFDEVERALFDMSLCPGVRRSLIAEYRVIDFVYDKRLRLRGLQRTCRRRNSDHPCVSCVLCSCRRKCVNPMYEYFLRPIGDVDPQSIDECRAHLLGHNSAGFVF
mmetsp:Transcript_15735/g.34129  ORF Transcript_15735/g.34129 Transcript_15735/m.34129 type:complete len:211 (-) Transcript_15735:113-745(-)